MMARNFNEIIAEIDGGALLEQLSEKLAEVSRAVKETGKVGSLDISLKVKLNRKNQVYLAAATKGKIPEEGIAEAVFFVSDTGDLTRHDPEQADLFIGGLKSVN
jgi:uncharacterized protein YfaS (alpha-2-macroglobulin family)